MLAAAYLRSILHPPSFLLSFLNSLRRFSSRSILDFTISFFTFTDYDLTSVIR